MTFPNALSNVDGYATSFWVSPQYITSETLERLSLHDTDSLTGRQFPAVQASLLAPAIRSPLVVPARALRDHEQLAERVGPTMVGAAPQTP
jgi:hypothetical protein